MRKIAYIKTCFKYFTIHKVNEKEDATAASMYDDNKIIFLLKMILPNKLIYLPTSFLHV